MLNITALSKAEQLAAARIFGPSGNQKYPAFTGNDPAQYHKLRRYLDNEFRGKNVEYIVDYRIQAALPGFPGFGVNGVNIVEAVIPVMRPSRQAMVIDRVEEYKVAVDARHEDINEIIEDSEVPEAKKAELRVHELLAKEERDFDIDNRFPERAEEAYFKAEERYLKAVKKFEKDTATVHELFLRYFAGPALVQVLPMLTLKHYRRALWTLDQANHFAENNIQAGNALQVEVRGLKFQDTEPIRGQIDRMVQAFDQLEAIGMPLNDMDKKGRLISALSNASLIQKLFSGDIQYLTQPVPAGNAHLNFANSLDVISQRINTLSAETASLGLVKPDTRKRILARANVTEEKGYGDDVYEEEEEEDLEVANVSQAKPSTAQCPHCGKYGHVAKNCWKMHKCKICGKKGHVERNCKGGNTEASHASSEPKNDSEGKTNLAGEFRANILKK
jgi:hypothetical protein